MFKALKEWLSFRFKTNKRRKIAKRLKTAMKANDISFS